MTSATKEKHPTRATLVRRVGKASARYEKARTDRREAIVSAIEAGATVSSVADAVGVTRAAIYKIVERSGSDALRSRAVGR